MGDGEEKHWDRERERGTLEIVEDGTTSVWRKQRRHNQRDNNDGDDDCDYDDYNDDCDWFQSTAT